MKMKFSTVQLTELALFIAIIIAMKATGLTSIPVGPLVMTLAMIPIALGAMLMGPLAGGVLGMVYGFTSLYDAVTGASAMTGIFFQLSPIHTIILCVVTRTIVGVAAGYLFRLFRKIDKTNTICYYLGGLITPLLNTILFMGYIVLVFYHTDYIQERISILGATGPLTFIVLTVGVQGIVEAVSGLIISGSVGKALAVFLGKQGSRTENGRR